MDRGREVAGFMYVLPGTCTVEAGGSLPYQFRPCVRVPFRLEFKEHLVQPVKEATPKWKLKARATRKSQATANVEDKTPLGVITYGMKGGRPTSAGGWRPSA